MVHVLIIHKLIQTSDLPGLNQTNEFEGKGYATYPQRAKYERDVGWVSTGV